MDWSSIQKEALDSADNWLAREGETDWCQVFRIFGYAGTGKTTLAQHFSGMVQGVTMFAAYTGKAAFVLRNKGCTSASTIHSLIYLPKNKSAEKLHSYKEELAKCTDTDRQRELHALIRRENDNLQRPSFSLNLDSELQHASLLIIDEVSMVGGQMGEDLLSFGVPILVLGDPAQLPPVADGGYFTKSKPNVMLTEIHRQAEGSPIIRMATMIRTDGRLEVGQTFDGQSHAECHVVQKGRTSITEITEFDQILVGLNATRKLINDKVRTEVRGYKDHLPVPGDRLVCGKNNHSLGLLNGSLWDVVACEVVDDDTISVQLQDPNDERVVINTLAHRHYFEDRVGEMDYWQRNDADQFEYGYALTVHKAQGSQWGNVFLVDESGCFRNDWRKWLYTGITRAANKLVVSM